MSDLYLLHYNNMYNRIVKRFDTLSQYQSYQIGNAITGVNFNPNDGVDATHVINWNNDVPDYLLVVDGSSIISRWYVVESTRLRNGQFRMQLKRDVIADHFTEVQKSTCFVEKGYLQQGNPLIFNNENMGFNQIKKAEYLLKNNLETPWLVLYLARYNNEGEYNTFSGEFNNVAYSNVDYTLSSLEDYIYYRWRNRIIWPSDEYPYQYLPYNTGIEFSIRFVNTAQYETGYSTLYFGENGYRIVYYDDSIDHRTNYPTLNGNPRFSNSAVNDEWKWLLELYHALDATQDGLPVNTITGLGTEEGYNTLINEARKIIQINGGTQYRITLTSGPINWHSTTLAYSITKGTNLYQEIIDSMIIAANMSFDQTSGDATARINMPYSGYSSREIVFNSVDEQNFVYNFNYSSGSVTSDAVYEILAAPLYDIEFTIGSETFEHSGDIALQWFQDIINKYYSAGFAYDLQIVPYCPVDSTNITNYEITYAAQQQPIADINRSVGIKLPSASFSEQLNIDIEYNANKKISNETEVFRIVSPNGVGEYEFSPSKNNGFSAFEVDCTLIPFNPYIKINPVFSGMYGADYNDYRGLICGGDFSLPILNNEWETYQLSNKYYQDIFQRKIETQEYNNKWQLASGIAGATVGALGGAAAGGMATGNPIGAIAGGVLSAAGGALDVVAQQSIFRENINLQKDLFGYELGTVKARSETLTRTTAYNINNKYFPYVEYYTCTDEELEALENKIKYNGMTVGVIGIIEDYLNPLETSYFQGQLIEIDITEDSHMVREIARVLAEGIRFYVD